MHRLVCNQPPRENWQNAQLITFRFCWGHELLNIFVATDLLKSILRQVLLPVSCKPDDGCHPRIGVVLLRGASFVETKAAA